MIDQEKLEYTINKANEGDIDCLLELGSYYEEGKNVEQDFFKAFECYKKAADKGSDEACNYVGLFYQDGIGVDKDYNEAVNYFNKAIAYGDTQANGNLGYLYLNGLGVKRDYEKANEIFKEYHQNDKYILNILKQINNGSKIVEINNINELKNKKYNELEDNDIVIINDNDNVNYHGYYEYRICKKIINAIDNFLEDIDINQSEIDTFIQIYVKLANSLLYDHDAYDYENCKDYVLENATTTRNLVGILKGKSVCRGHAKILKNILNFVNIDSRTLTSYDHSFNKVKIDEKWYYCDLTKDILNIRKGKEIENCLISKKEFENCISHIAFNDNKFDNNSDSTYSNINEIIWNSKNIKKI